MTARSLVLMTLSLLTLVATDASSDTCSVARKLDCIRRGESWHNWVQFFRWNDYDAVAASWPGDSETTEATRKNAGAVAGYGVREIADHFKRAVSLTEPQFRFGFTNAVPEQEARDSTRSTRRRPRGDR